MQVNEALNLLDRVGVLTQEQAEQICKALGVDGMQPTVHTLDLGSYIINQLGLGGPSSRDPLISAENQAWANVIAIAETIGKRTGHA